MNVSGHILEKGTTTITIFGNTHTIPAPTLPYHINNNHNLILYIRIHKIAGLVSFIDFIPVWCIFLIKLVLILYSLTCVLFRIFRSLDH